ncbi:ABC transporter permease [Actinocrinis sp.]|uniref:ABC transporter permease n=1 Tax=Actinocrinis sp. TaxID=1920516 RepID=UPI002CC86538|nr:ABC transporter permease [Actinocrinis sp.]HXR70556.1 ABC transporter permease [Actinocrinis sp.]
MFFTYLTRELRRRGRQAFVIALGLALGIGLTITVTAASAGVNAAQKTVLHSLYGVGTDMTVTSTAAAGSGRQSFNFRGPDAGSTTGTKSSTTTSDNLTLSPGTSAITSATLTKIKSVSGVSAAVGSLALNDFNISTTVSQQVTQQPSTNSGGTFERGGSGSSSGGPAFGGPASGGGFFNSTSVTGVDTSNLSVGPVSTLTLASGRMLTAADAKSYVAVITQSYASSKSLKLGGTITLGGKSFKIIGLASGSTSSNVYIPLGIAQALSGQTSAVTTVYVKADNSTQIDAVAAAIKKVDSTATVTTSADLAKSVTGSISSAASLANNLGKWLSIAVLIAAFAVAALFTMSAVGRRVREFGTLKALGWTSRRVVRQVMGEAIVTGLIGGALGIGLGFAAAFAIDQVAPSLTASTGGITTPTGNGLPGGSGAGGEGGGAGGGFRQAASQAVTVHLSAPVALNVLLLAVALAVLGGLIAGGFGGWRASSLRPADALRKVA